MIDLNSRESRNMNDNKNMNDKRMEEQEQDDMDVNIMEIRRMNDCSNEDENNKENNYNGDDWNMKRHSDIDNTKEYGNKSPNGSKSDKSDKENGNLSNSCTKSHKRKFSRDSWIPLPSEKAKEIEQKWNES